MTAKVNDTYAAGQFMVGPVARTHPVWQQAT